MPEPRTFTGGCHCGLVRYECTSDLAMVTACNCSICTKKGLHIAFVDPRSFSLAAGEESLREYKFNRHVIAHQMCSECGVEAFARGQKPDGTPVIAVNVSTIDGIDLADDQDDAVRREEALGRYATVCRSPPSFSASRVARGGMTAPPYRSSAL